MLVEQRRPSVDSNVVEWPAGLAGDSDAWQDESLEDAARRELLEETGYQARHWRRLVTVASSPGLTDEVVTFFLAFDAERIAAGGGDASEEIIVHEVALTEIDAWLADKSGDALVDARVYSGLYLLRQQQAASAR